MSHKAFFKSATGHSPYACQSRLDSDAWPDILDVPIGLGKAAGVTLVRRVRPAGCSSIALRIKFWPKNVWQFQPGGQRAYWNWGLETPKGSADHPPSEPSATKVKHQQ